MFARPQMKFNDGRLVLWKMLQERFWAGDMLSLLSIRNRIGGIPFAKLIW